MDAMPRPLSYLRISNAGNLVLRTHYGIAGKWSDAVVYSTKGMGDRRQRKAAAKAEWKAREKIYAAVTWTTTSPGVVRRINVSVTITT
jgi:hypothetical protein